MPVLGASSTPWHHIEGREALSLHSWWPSWPRTHSSSCLRLRPRRPHQAGEEAMIPHGPPCHGYHQARVFHDPGSGLPELQDDDPPQDSMPKGGWVLRQPLLCFSCFCHSPPFVCSLIHPCSTLPPSVSSVTSTAFGGWEYSGARPSKKTGNKGGSTCIHKGDSVGGRSSKEKAWSGRASPGSGAPS